MWHAYKSIAITISYSLRVRMRARGIGAERCGQKDRHKGTRGLRDREQEQRDEGSSSWDRESGGRKTGIGKDLFRLHQWPGCTHALAPRAIQPVYKVSSSSIVVFHGIPPWERRVNKHLSFLARSHGQVKMSQLGGPVSAYVLLLLFLAPPHTFFLLRGTAGCLERETHSYKLWRLE